VDRSERRSRWPRVAHPKTEARGSMVGPLAKRVLGSHPSFSTNPIGDWKELVGDQVARYCQPRSLKHKVLVVVAYDSVWKYHLELHREALIGKINRGRSEPLLEKIVIRVGELLEEAPSLNPVCQNLEKAKAGKARPKKRKKLPSRPLTPEEKALLESLKDPDLRAVGSRLLKHIPLENE
jgi:predicted nucleic acid-binding Zn ribbon protein